MAIGTKAGACPHFDERTCTECGGLSDSARLLLRQMSKLSELTPSTPIPVLPRLGYGGRLTLITGRESSGKSTLLRAALAAMSIGKDWLTDERIQPVPAVWIGEERRDDIKAEFSCFEELKMSQDLVRVGSVADVHDVADLHDVIHNIGAKIVVIDPVADLVNVRTAGSTYREMRQALLALRPPDADVAVIGVLHSGRRSTDSVSSYIGSAGAGRRMRLAAGPHQPAEGRRQRVPPPEGQQVQMSSGADPRDAVPVVLRRLAVSRGRRAASTDTRQGRPGRGRRTCVSARESRHGQDGDGPPLRDNAGRLVGVRVVLRAVRQGERRADE